MQKYQYKNKITNGDEIRWVLGVCNDVVFVSDTERLDVGFYATHNSLFNSGWTIVPDLVIEPLIITPGNPDLS